MVLYMVTKWQTRVSYTNNFKRLILTKQNTKSPILPGNTVIVSDVTSIYNGYQGFVQRISGDRAAILFDYDPWEKLITIPIKNLKKQ